MISDAGAAHNGEFGAALRSSRDASPFLGREEEVLLVRRAQAGDRQARERLVAANIRLIYREAHRYRCRSYSQDDLIQEGILGLMIAIDRFDESHGCRLSTYAMHWIRQSITRAVEQNDRLIHVPLQVTAELRRLLKLRDELHRDLGRPATDSELAQASGITEERVAHLLGSGLEAVSLEAMVGADGDSPLMDMAEDPSALDPEQDALLGVFRQQLRHLMGTLRPRERQVVEERFGFNDGHPRTLEDLSRRMRISRERVRQIEAAAMRKLRRALSAGNWD
jgi:RNA polymerase primary sigma factor